MEDCKECNGNGRITCTRCAGNTTVGGGLESSSQELCTKCSGSGSITCEACNGSGKT